MSFDLDLTASVDSIILAKNRTHKLCTTSSHETCKSHDLTCSYIKTCILTDHPSFHIRIFYAPVRYFEYDLPHLGFMFWISVLYSTSYHSFDDLIFINFAGFNVVAFNSVSVSYNGNRIRYSSNFVELMRDHDTCNPFILKLCHKIEKIFRIRFIKC